MRNRSVTNFHMLVNGKPINFGIQESRLDAFYASEGTTFYRTTVRFRIVDEGYTFQSTVYSYEEITKPEQAIDALLLLVKLGINSYREAHMHHLNISDYREPYTCVPRIG